MKQFYCLTLFFISLSYLSLGQTPNSDKVYTISRTARVATTNPTILTNPANAVSTIHYFDGAGRTLQTIGYAVSPTQKDIVAGVSELDPLGRPKKAYLPVPVTTASGALQTDIPAKTQTFYNDSAPYNEVESYEASPMSNPIKVVGAGAVYHSGSTKGVVQSYKTAAAGVRKYSIQSDGQVVGAQSYADGCLMEYKTVDEDGNESYQVVGKSGRVIQVRQKDRSSATYLTTAYVYDIMGRLRYVIPPKVFNSVVNFYETDVAFIEGVYATHYDGKGRVIETHKPGGGWTHFVYNELDQVVMTQDSRQRETNLWEWVKYDGHGRVVMKGTKTTSEDRQTLQGYFTGFTVNEQFEERSTSSGLMGYTAKSFPYQISLSATDVMAVYYFDDYTWVTNSNLAFELYRNPQWTNVKGLPTGSVVRKLDNGLLLASVLYYDDKNRVIQTKVENRFGTVGVPNINQTDRVLTFAGDLTEERTIYRKPNESPIEVKTTYTYDNIGRVTGAVHTLNGKVTPLAQYKYNEIGEMVQKRLMQAGNDNIIESSPQPNGNQDIANKYVLLEPGTITAENGSYLACVAPDVLQEIDFSYNIRGQLRGINLDANGNFSLTNGDVFGLKLDYYETATLYNGKLHKQTWKSSTNTTITREFTYNYDGYDRFYWANYVGQASENYTLPYVFYDDNGNITGLQRNGYLGGSWGLTDNLLYTYQSPTVGNRLTGIRDYGNTAVGFKDNGNSNDYTYYSDGSQKSDANKGITLIEYNFLGLPDKITFGTGVYIQNSYDAEGLKLSQKFVNGSTITQTDYMGELIYVDGVLASILHDEGRIRVPPSGTNGAVYQFFINDHLGSTRAIIERLNGSTALVQETHYGPWGEVLEGIGQTGDWNFLFQGKEWVNDVGFDFGSRFYDPYNGRFLQLDGANQFASGYTGMGNMPMVGVDPDGQWVQYIIGAGVGGFSGYQIGKAHGATGWKMAGYIFAGAGIGAATAGLGTSLLGGFSTVATSGVSLGQSIAAYGTVGAISGAVGSGGFAILGGQNVETAMLMGASFGFLGGVASGYLQHISFNSFANGVLGNSPLLAQNGDPLYYGGQLNEVSVVGQKLSYAGTGRIDQNYFFEELFTGGKIFKGLAWGFKYAGGFLGIGVRGAAATTTGSNLWRVGTYSELKGIEAGLQAHHVGQKSLLSKFVTGYDPLTAPSILVPKAGHVANIPGIGRVVATKGLGNFTNARQVLARDIFELRRVYGSQGIPNNALQELIQMNKKMYPGAFIK